MTTQSESSAGSQTVSVNVFNGPSVAVPWYKDMTAQDAMEAAYVAIGDPKSFTYALQFFGTYGYLVVMINDTYETFSSSAAPNYFWEFLVNGFASSKGIDDTFLNPGDVILFELQAYVAGTHAATTVGVKYDSKKN